MEGAKTKEKMARVFITQEPQRRDRATGIMKPFHDLSPAAAYGDIQILMPPGAISLSPGPTMDSLARKLDDFSDDDSLLLLGDPILIAMAAAICSWKNRGVVGVLKWDRNTGKYIRVQFKV